MKMQVHVQTSNEPALTQDEGDLDLGQLQEVLGNVDGQLVQEGWGDVEAVLNIVQVSGSLAEVVCAGEHRIVGASPSLASLVQAFHHVPTTSDVLLQHNQSTSERIHARKQGLGLLQHR